MSLRWRIMGSLVLLAALTVAISVGVGYWATESRLNVFVSEIADDQAAYLARSVSEEYTAVGGWHTIGDALERAGYLNAEASHDEGEDSRGDEAGESFHLEQVRVVITDVNGRVVTDNMSVLASGADATDLDGSRRTVYDLSTNQPVGRLFVDVDQELLSSESHGFLSTLLYIILFAGLGTVAAAILLSNWLAKRITAPVKALTEATQAIARGDSTPLDITTNDELGRMSAAFNQMADTLETQRELRRRLIHDLSHELNTPLSVVQLEAAGLRDGLQSPEQAAEQIVQEVDRLRGLLTDLNALAETDSGELRLDSEQVAVSDLLSREVTRWQPRADARGVALSLEPVADLPEIPVDRMRISQALGNVLNNAIQSTEPGGDVVVRAALGPEQSASISVIDDGVGISADDLPHLFDRLYRTAQSRDRGVSGSGLGLAITRAIVEAHGGTVTAESDGPGQGATITLTLPAVE
ncbi:MAG: HAMP domain-containing histidine kinase [Chloroflexi bacterium]|nr:HAMP domain-containing histidine kinase [Chloroflexota bacterium]MYF80976.1 HAMP domain-containing histidine kinase [Chloroflexota bacterium]MYI05170.1 HAMP domain-containing histidine kinase [Chloroflexota bacterium]